ncbi:MAG: indole-3-glycerol phosphate synthase TrpC [Cyclobacteriaceae bacterium]|jgi:indole-3-glycerol phosphate synthase|nr:indole-3-glycerol phosphate synthase TrpC [Cytophagales bacterium]MCZ8328799.1 indole-3-glycerol phosphate synthase TrpC [Cyclobacteriaceae bacterium]
MNILEKIVEKKKEEVAQRKELYPIKLLEKSLYFPGKTVSLKKYLKREGSSQIIAEFKKKSPSKGFINPYAQVEKISVGYMQAGAAALSILTDTEFFGGSNQDLLTARKFNFCPILRKDFIIDPYQIIESKSIGADVILLIAAILSEQESKELSAFAKSLELEVLLEVHDADEIKKSDLTHVDVVGINNRNLKTFEVSIENSMRLLSLLPKDKIKIAESGIDNIDTIKQLKEAGFEGFLMGEYFMKQPKPEWAAKQLIASLQPKIVL